MEGILCREPNAVRVRFATKGFVTESGFIDRTAGRARGCAVLAFNAMHPSGKRLLRQIGYHPRCE